MHTYNKGYRIDFHWLKKMITLQKLLEQRGIEPPTSRMRSERSTTELLPRWQIYLCDTLKINIINILNRGLRGRHVPWHSHHHRQKNNYLMPQPMTLMTSRNTSSFFHPSAPFPSPQQFIELFQWILRRMKATRCSAAAKTHSIKPQYDTYLFINYIIIDWQQWMNSSTITTSQPHG